MGYNLDCFPESEVSTVDGWKSFKDAKLKNYFACKATSSLKTLKEKDFSMPESVNSVEEWIANPRAKSKNIRLFYGNQHRIDVCYFAILDISRIPIFNLEHSHLSSCQFCYDEIIQNLKFGTLHK